jgi:cyclomaltodextrinase
MTSIDKKSTVSLLASLAFGFAYAAFSIAQEKVVNQSQFSAAPEWAKTAVWYQIFPERFRNGDPSNDPKPKDLIGSWPHEVAAGWQISKWTGDWYQLQPWERNGTKGFYFYAQTRRYGGDLQGVLDKLDYLKDLGITAIYFTPLFKSPSLHKYDATMYHHIDNNFGPDPVGDEQLWSTENPADPSTWKWSAADKLFIRLVGEAHRRGIKIIIDGVFNHVGMTFWAFEDVKKNQQQSPYKDWFVIKRWDDPATPQNEFDYQGWNGVRELPELREDDNGIVHGPREHIHAIVKRWMDPNGDGNPEDGVDGWRLDVAEKVNTNFWREFRAWARAINPQAYLVGEVWWEDWQKEKMFNAAPWLQGDMFDAVMNYRWAREAMRFFAGKKTRISASEFVRRLQRLLHDYPEDHDYVLLNLYDSHDTDRLASHIVNGDALYDKHVGPNDNPSYDVRKPTERERATQKLMALFQMTYVGAPMIYYGTEAGMWGAGDPDCRKPMLWPDYKFHDEKSHPFNKERPSDPNRFDQGLLQWYSKLIKLRNSYPALRTGMFDPILVLDDKDVLVFQRGGAEGTIVVALNNSWTDQRVSIPVSNHQQQKAVVELLSGKRNALNKGCVTLTLNAKSGMVLR